MWNCRALGREGDFYRLVQARKPKFSGTPNSEESRQIVVYLDWGPELAGTFGVNIFISLPIEDATAFDTFVGGPAFQAFIQLERQLARIHARNFAELDDDADAEWLRLQQF